MDFYQLQQELFLSLENLATWRFDDWGTNIEHYGEIKMLRLLNIDAPREPYDFSIISVACKESREGNREIVFKK